MSRLRRHVTARAGHTVLEVAIGMGAFSVLLLGTMGATLGAKGAFQSATVNGEMATRAQRALDRIADELSLAGMSTISPTPTLPFGASSVRFQAPIGLVNSTITWSAGIKIELVPAKTDPKNGRDDDGDGWKDEGALVLVTNIGLGNQKITVIASDVAPLFVGELANGKDDNQNGLVDEAGFSVVVDGSRLVMRLALAGADQHGRPRLESAITSVRLRN